ncbi:polyprenyl synthetase family protein [Staphylococcus debuckii]|uniref:polyprenyl synthetase family protein n=1 Tax=Staphylococcus debuckii TaxID=2044912 RepID=UPI000F42F6F4|nr:polyprenyl synthetase family protein [Staphylococcus debuckii]AYU55272.1 heptaprenyl diphosphate synthase [Staphylococcus debuckii]
MEKLNINKEIKKIEKELKNTIKSGNPILEEASLHLLSSGGKRVRPSFVVLSSEYGPYPRNEETYKIAVSLELIHMATLVHDDVIDRSDKRRGRYTISKKWDQETAILTGNYLLALALNHISSIQDKRIHMILSNAIIDVCRGELFQFQDQFNSKQTITNYLRRINRKTALLIQLATELGALSADADLQTANKLKRIGHYIGMSFQIVDDVLDFTSTEKQLGKPVGSDLMNGHLTLPVLLERRKNPQFKALIDSLGPNSPNEDFEYCVRYIRSSESIEQSKAISKHYLNKALDLLGDLETSPASTWFKKLIKRMESRNT